MRNRNNGTDAGQALARHEPKCTICRHADREAIEEEFVHWRDVWQLARQYGIEDYRTVYRHARATGLIELRRENIRSALDNIVEHSETAQVTGETILRAIRAYSCIDDSGRWIDPPSRVVFTTARADAPLPAPRPPQAVEAVHDERSAPVAQDSGSSVEAALLSPAPIEACRASSSHQVEVEAAASNGQAAPLIYGTGIRNGRNVLKRKDKIFLIYGKPGVREYVECSKPLREKETRDLLSGNQLPLGRHDATLTCPRVRKRTALSGPEHSKRLNSCLTV